MVEVEDDKLFEVRRDEIRFCLGNRIYVKHRGVGGIIDRETLFELFEIKRPERILGRHLIRSIIENREHTFDEYTAVRFSDRIVRIRFCFI